MPLAPSEQLLALKSYLSSGSTAACLCIFQFHEIRTDNVTSLIAIRLAYALDLLLFFNTVLIRINFPASFLGWIKSSKVFGFTFYPIYSAIRGFYSLSRMTTNNLISPMIFCYNTNFTLPKQFQRFRSILLDGSRFLGLFWKKKTWVL